MIRVAALAAYKAGLCILPTAIDGSKAPAIKPWGAYKTIRPSVAELRAWRFDQADGFGVVAGAVSGHVECWDFDTTEVSLAFEAAAHATGLGDVWSRLTTGYLDRTPGGGVRILARYPPDATFTDCTLARRPGRTGEPDIKTLIELPTYAIVAPSNGKTHPTGGTYERLSGGFDTIASYTNDERAALMTLARTFDQIVRAEQRPSSSSSSMGGDRPGDDYNRRTTWAALLEPHGWMIVFDRDDVSYWRRPGKTCGVSATTNFAGSDLFYPFTSSTIFEADKSYSKFAVYAVLEHDGDFSRAALALYRQGYGRDHQHEPGSSPGPTVHTVEGLDPELLIDIGVVVVEGRHMAETGVPYLVDGLIPAIGTVGLLVAYTKVGKTTFTLTLGGAVAAGVPFLDRHTRAVRVLVIAAEDPPAYTAYLARHLTAVPVGQMTFYRAPIRLDDTTLTAIAATIQTGQYGLVLISSWQAVVAGLTRDENDNATAVRIMETVKVTARASGVPWLIDAHSGKGEDQGDDADPTKAMRGASGAAGAADYLLSLRYDVGGPFTTRRRLSGKGRFVTCPPMLLEYDPDAGAYSVLSVNKDTMVETTWRLIVETQALTTTPQTATAIAQAAGLVTGAKVTTSIRRRVQDALRRRPGVRTITETWRGHIRTLYASQDFEVAPNPQMAHPGDETP